ncbi:MAG: hypothetical protein GXP35_10810 [Actinobacteria bacterium]|nr:hypothetical protein [Actinomycetota bacterium]
MSLYIGDHELLQHSDPFARLLCQPGVVEEVELRGSVGFMAFHGGQLEETTDVVAREAALASGSSYYGVVQPSTDQWHIPSHRVTADQSDRLAAFMTHIDVVIAIHGFGRPELWRSILIGGRNRQLAEFTAIRLIPVLPHYEILTDLETIPKELRGQHQSNPVNRARGGGIQIELPPRVRGNSPIFWGRDVSKPVPHLTALIDALSCAARDWSVP